MADRNPSKQRRQAQNRAEREARKARSQAANTPVEERRVVEEPEPRKGRRSRRDRPAESRPAKGKAEVKARARSIIEASEATPDDVDHDEADDGSLAGAPDPVARRGASPVFSPRHRAAVAAVTADEAPARTHVGVAEATGTAIVGPRKVGASRPRSTKSNGSGSTRATSGTKGASGSTRVEKQSATRAPSSASTKTRSTAGSSRSPKASQRSSSRPPAKPLPPFLDRFGGNEPGGRWVMLSFATVLIASVVVNFVHIVPEIVENSKGKKVQTGEYFTIWHYGLGPGLYFLLPPIVILGLFILTARPWDRRRSWNFALALLVLSTFVAQSISIFVIPIACLAWGCWQARKAALEEVGGDPRVLREVERERRIAHKEAMREQRRR